MITLLLVVVVMGGEEGEGRGEERRGTKGLRWRWPTQRPSWGSWPISVHLMTAMRKEGRREGRRGVSGGRTRVSGGREKVVEMVGGCMMYLRTTMRVAKVVVMVVMVMVLVVVVAFMILRMMTMTMRKRMMIRGLKSSEGAWKRRW